MRRILTNDALRHSWSRRLEKCVDCGLTAEECERMGVAPQEVYCKARLPNHPPAVKA